MFLKSQKRVYYTLKLELRIMQGNFIIIIIRFKRAEYLYKLVLKFGKTKLMIVNLIYGH
jgi:hypothetical protein